MNEDTTTDTTTPSDPEIHPTLALFYFVVPLCKFFPSHSSCDPQKTLGHWPIKFPTRDILWFCDWQMTQQKYPYRKSHITHSADWWIGGAHYAVPRPCNPTHSLRQSRPRNSPFLLHDQISESGELSKSPIVTVCETGIDHPPTLSTNPLAARYSADILVAFLGPTFRIPRRSPNLHA